MRVLMASIYFPPRLGGIESHVYYLARGLARRGHTVELITMRTDPGSAAREEPAPGLRVTRVPSAGPNLAGWLLGGAAMIGPALARARWADVVHAHTHQTAPAAASASWWGGKPLLLTVHSSHFLRLARHPAWRPLLAGLISPARLILGTSDELRDVAQGLVPGVPCRAIVNGVDTDVFRPTAPVIARRGTERILLAARRLVPKNGVEYLVRAMVHLTREFTVHLYLVGDGPLRGELEGLARELGVAEVVSFLGPVANDQMPAYYSSADVVVMPSLVEATSVAALEAMACGVPVAASRVGGLPEIVSEENGILFAAGDPENLAQKVLELLVTPDLARRGERGREIVIERWSLERLVDRHEEFYRLLRTGLRGKHLAQALAQEEA